MPRFYRTGAAVKSTRPPRITDNLDCAAHPSGCSLDFPEDCRPTAVLGAVRPQSPPAIAGSGNGRNPRRTRSSCFRSVPEHREFHGVGPGKLQFRLSAIVLIRVVVFGKSALNSDCLDPRPQALDRAISSSPTVDRTNDSP